MLTQARYAVLDAMHRRKVLRNLPGSPVMSWAFEPYTDAMHLTGFYYRQSEVDLHGSRQYGGNGFAVSRGTPILAPFRSGLYMATFSEVRMGRTMSMNKIQELYPTENQLTIPFGVEDNESLELYSDEGLVIQGICEDTGLIVRFTNLDSVRTRIPYHPPTLTRDGYAASEMLRSPLVERYDRDNPVVLRLERNEMLGITGMTGCGWGEPSYEYESVRVRPIFRFRAYSHWRNPYVGWFLGGPRHPLTRNSPPIDMFGSYGTVDDFVPGRVHPSLLMDSAA